MHDDPRPILRQFVATLAYRAAKVLRDTPRDSRRCNRPKRGGPFRFSRTWRPDDVGALAGTRRLRVEGRRQRDSDTEVRRFFDGLAALDAELSAERPFEGSTDQLIQGPLADALTHVGQLGMLRGMAGAPFARELLAEPR